MKKILRYVLPVALTVVLLWSLFRKVDFHQTMELLRRGVDYWWILAAMGISVFSHIFRAMRWQIQFDALHIKTSLMELTCSIFGCYALNLAIPRLGEVWRCTFVAHRSKASLTTVMGSMVADRMADIVMVGLLTLSTFVLAASALRSFLAKYPMGAGLLALLENPWMWLGVVTVAVIGVIVVRRKWESPAMLKIRRWTSEIWKGFAVIVTMPGKWKFVWLSIAIWGCYFVQLYVAMYAFDFTRALCTESSLAYGLLPCLVAFTLSSIGMAVPSNGGLGPWNIAVMFGFAIYGVSDVEGAAFSILQWSGQTVMLIALGIFTMVWIALSGRKLKKTHNGLQK